MANRYVSTLFSSGEEFEDFLNKLEAFKEGVKDGTIVITKAKHAETATKATQDNDGNVIPDTYAKKSDLTGGTLKVAKAASADSATNASTAYSAEVATKAQQDVNGNFIHTTYRRKDERLQFTSMTTTNGISFKANLERGKTYLIKIHDTALGTTSVIMSMPTEEETSNTSYVSSSVGAFNGIEVKINGYLTDAGTFNLATKSWTDGVWKEWLNTQRTTVVIKYAEIH